jgi:hypothetical protein
MDSGIYDASADAGPGLDPCDKCLDMQCGTELDACLKDDMCFTGDPQNPGQYELVVACVENLRVTQKVRRVDFRDCGIDTVNASGTAWPPIGMAQTTTNVMNCMAMGQPNDNTWASSTNVTQAWPTNSCAALACTAMIPPRP